MSCINQQPPQRDGAVPNLVWVGSKWLLVFPRIPVTPGTPLTQTIFSPCSPLNDRKRVARSLFKTACLLCSLARLLLISGNVHPNPCLVFPRSVCARNVTWRGKSVQCCTCPKWVHLKCSLISFSRFRSLGSSHSWSSPACFFWRSHTYQHCDFLLGLLQLVYLHSSIWLLPMHHPHPTLAFQPFILFPPTLSSPSASSPPPHTPSCFSLPPASSPP